MTDNLVNLDFTDNSNANQVIKANESIGELKNSSESNNGLKNNLQVLDDNNCIISLSPNSTVARGEELEEEEQICFIPEVNFSGISTLDSIERESQPLLGREHHEITYNQFPGKFNYFALDPNERFSLKILNLQA